MERVTKKDVESAFGRFLTQIKGRKPEAYNDVGAYYLDYAACYGGYQIVRVVNERGALSNPFGHMRRNAREMVDCLNFYVSVERFKGE